METTITASEELIQRLEQIQTEGDLSNRSFTSDLLHGAISFQTWNQVRARTRPLTLHFLRTVRTYVDDPTVQRLTTAVLDEHPTRLGGKRAGTTDSTI